MKSIQLLFVGIVLSIILNACNRNEVTASFEPLIGSEVDSAVSYFTVDDGNISILNSYYKAHNYETASGNLNEFVLSITEQINDNGSNKLLIQPRFANLEISNWSIETAASQYDVSKNLLTLALPATNETEALYQIYNMENGNALIDYTYGLLEAYFPDGVEKRLFGFHSNKSPITLNGKPSGDKQIGYFTYTSDSKGINMIIIKAKNSSVMDSIDRSTPVMEFLSDTTSNHLVINSGKGLYLSGEAALGTNLSFSITTSFFYGNAYEALEIIIPIVGDKIEKKNLKYNSELFEIEVIQL